MLRRIETVEFQRSEGSEWETGLQLNYGELGILDRYGDFVDDVWDIKFKDGLIIDNLDIILNREAVDKIREEEFNKQEQLKKETKKHGITEDIETEIKEISDHNDISVTKIYSKFSSYTL